LAIERHRGLQRNEWHTSPDPTRERFVQAARLAFEETDFNLDTGGAQLAESAPRDGWIWVAHCRHHAANSRGDQGIGARAGAPSVRAGLEVDVEGCSASSLARDFQRENLCVLAAFVAVKALANHPAAANEDRSD